MSRIYYSTITLKHLIQSSDGIIEVQKSEPFAVTEDIPIHEDTKKYPPFKKTTYHFKTIDILYKKRGLEIEPCITVLPADHGSLYDLHVKYHMEGISKSPVYSRYQPSVDFYNTDRLIVFLISGDEGFELTAQDACESISKKNKLLRLCRSCGDGETFGRQTWIERIRSGAWNGLSGVRRFFRTS